MQSSATPRRTTRWGAAGLTLAAVATSLTVAVAVATAPAARAALPAGFKSVGYMPSWAGSVDSIQYGKLTHVNYSWDCNGTGAQVWRAQADGTLRNPASGRCLDATGPGSADGTRLQIWNCFAGANQVWRLPA